MTAVAAIINYNGKVLVGKKRSDSKKILAGQWHIPGETIEGNETDEEALIRGMEEETGLDILIGSYIASSITPTPHSNIRWYECFAQTDKTRCGSDLEEIRWVSKREVLNECSPEAVSRWPQKVVDYFAH